MLGVAFECARASVLLAPFNTMLWVYYIRHKYKLPV